MSETPQGDDIVPPIPPPPTPAQIITGLAAVIGLIISLVVLINPNAPTTQFHAPQTPPVNTTTAPPTKTPGNNTVVPQGFAPPIKHYDNSPVAITEVMKLRSLILDPGTVMSRVDGAVNQGDMIFIPTEPLGPKSKGSMCTVGFIDHMQHRIWVAGHCFNASAKKNYPLQAYTKDDKRIGSAFRVGSGGNSDIAYIEAPANMLGNNVFTGDAIADISDIPKPSATRPGRMCAFSRMSNTTSCGDVDYLRVARTITPQGSREVTDIVGNSSLVRAMGAASHDVIHQGDSGGPAWIYKNGKRLFVGVISSTPIDLIPYGGVGFSAIPLRPWLYVTMRPGLIFPDVSEHTQCDAWIYNSHCEGITSDARQRAIASGGLK